MAELYLKKLLEFTDILLSLSADIAKNCKDIIKRNIHKFPLNYCKNY